MIIFTILCTLFTIFALDKLLLSFTPHIEFAHTISYLISPPFLLIVMGSIGLYGLIKEKKALFIWKYAPLSGSQLLAEGFNRLLKLIIGRPRPYIDAPFAPFSFDSHFHSLPSGHATGAFALATSLSYLYPSKQHLFYILAIVLSLSRLCTGDHYLGDIVAGALVGIFSSRLLHKVSMRIRQSMN